MAQSERQVENAATDRTTAVGAFLPSLSVSSGASLRSQDRFDATTDRIVSGSADSYNAGVSTSLALFSWRSPVRRSRPEPGRLAGGPGAEGRSALTQVTLQTKRFFFTALRQGELLDVANARLSQAVESLDLTRRQARVGMATRSDTLRARLEMVNARQAVLEAETAARSARFALARQVGADQPVIPVAPRRPRARALAHQRGAGAPARGAGCSLGPSGGGFHRSGCRLVLGGPGRVSADAPAVVGLQLGQHVGVLCGRQRELEPEPVGRATAIFNGFQREAAVARADESRTVARLQEEDARLAARQAADGALRTLATAETGIDIAQEAVALADEDLRAIRERYRVGVATAFDVVTSQIALDQARVNLVGSRYDYVTAKAELEAVLGREL